MSSGVAELLVGVLSALVVVDVALAVALARALQRLARLEEHARISEKILNPERRREA